MEKVEKSYRDYSKAWASLMDTLRAFDIYDENNNKVRKLDLFNEWYDQEKSMHPNQDFELERCVNYTLLRSGLHSQYHLELNKTRKTSYNEEESRKERVRNVLMKKVSTIIRDIKGRTEGDTQFLTTYQQILDTCLKTAIYVFNNHPTIENDVEHSYI